MKRLVLAVAVVVLGAGTAFWIVTRGETMQPAKLPPREVAAAKLRGITQQRIFFGHQSVGEDILRGVGLLKAEFSAAGVGMPAIREIKSVSEIDGPGIYHAKVGRNVEPLTKIEAFEDWLVAQGAGAKVDTAILKFCYVDFSKKTDLDGVLNAYLESIERIKKAHPTLRIVHATSPLTARPTGLKDQVRMAKEGHVQNMARTRFNNALLQRVSPGDGVFDIALAESVCPDLTCVTYEHDGLAYSSLVSEYTYDGGHLNDTGARLAALAFVDALARD